MDLHRETGELQAFLQQHGRVLVLTGAGVSAASGIPTYRDDRGRWQHNRPIQQSEFLQDEASRRRYWARSWFGWPAVRDARPNPAHLALAELECRGHVELLVTQNVDRLHQRAGSRRVVDLHGRLDRVRCLACRRLYTRDAVQALLATHNRFTAPASRTARPDGDADVPDAMVEAVVTPRCTECAGDLMPDVVFFGGNVPGHRVRRCRRALERAGALLVLGSSLSVFSGFRFCRHAARLGKSIAIVNPGDTRADDMAELRLRTPAGPLLQSLVS